ncbi:hypothetical protein BIW11_10269 [Tropilaelaps mercedesae]|uniref:Uncharacterized protein n=1 Tax=Tropilaelaps mercedesae TaxID=418985 RepID=A0A1V9XGG6_9ACAR|nr:hypothetical protein BIW11_10269 [Tropilaelaps mercedesae]
MSYIMSARIVCSEVFGGSMSTLALDVIDKSIKYFQARAQDLNGEKEFTYARTIFLHTYNSQCFFPTYWPGEADYTADDLFSLSYSVAMAGRKIDDECVKISNRNKRRYDITRKTMTKFLTIIMECWQAENSLKNAKRTVASHKTCMDLTRFANSKQLFTHILGQLHIFEVAFRSHEKLILYGSVTNVATLALLAHCNNGASEAWNSSVYSDFARLTASCREAVESAGVPTAMATLARYVESEFGESFRKLSPEEAVKVLREGSGEAGRLFRNFLEEHGHRCMREFDVQTKSWAMDPTPLTKSIQAMVGATITSGKNITKALSDDQLIDTLDTRLPQIYRLALKFVLKRLQKGIALRESGKSLLVLSNDILRKYFWHLAAIMVSLKRSI